MSTKQKLLMRGNGYSFIYEGKTQVPQLTIIIGTFFSYENINLLSSQTGWQGQLRY